MGIREDIKAVFEKDPAARSTMEVLCCYPGLHAVWAHRIAHFLWECHFFFPARLMSHISRALTGIEIHPGAKLGKRVFIDHGSGVVIGETAEVGDDVLIYMGVVLGGTALHKTKRHPTVENNVVLGSGAILLGPITVGKGAKVGAGSVVIRSVPPGATAVGVPAKIAEPTSSSGGKLDHNELPDPVLLAMGQIFDRLNRLEDRFRLSEELKTESSKNGHMKAAVPEEQVRILLKEVIDPEVGTNIVDLGLVKEIMANGDSIDVNLMLTNRNCPMVDYLKDQIQLKLRGLKGIDTVNVNILDEKWDWSKFNKRTYFETLT
jgi:serine O-acetyltransferase